MKLLLGAALVGLGLLGLGGGGGAQAAYPGDNGRIAFTSTRDGNAEIYTMAPDGSGAVNLTSSAAEDSRPVWSPDGTRIAFTSTRDGNYEVYTMAPDGSDVVRLTNDAGFDYNSAWSPDGARIAFTSTRDGNDDVYSMAPDGSDVVRLTTDAAFDGVPAWSPDGTRIAFTSDRDGDVEIYTMAADGSDPVNLTNSATFEDNQAAWSPDGTRIVFTSTRDGGHEIYTMAPDGSDPRRLTDNVAFDAYPAWSPDGRRIAFTSGRDGTQYEIYTMAADGSDPVRLTDNSSLDLWPDWQPVPIPAPPAPPPPPPGPAAPPVASAPACLAETTAGFLYPAKMRVLRSRVLRSDRRLDVLAPITARARGGVKVTYQADRRSDTFSAEVTAGDAALDRIRFKQPITRGQARLGTGIVTLDYHGDADTRPEVVRLRAASQSADLDVEQISLLGDRLSAKGSVTGRAQGIVRFRYSYLDAAGHPQIYPARATIQDDGDWQLQDDVVPPQLARCGGYLSILFTGYFERRIRGEMLAYELNAGQTRRP